MPQLHARLLDLALGHLDERALLLQRRAQAQVFALQAVEVLLRSQGARRAARLACVRMFHGAA